MHEILPMLAARKSRRAIDLASVICKLVVDGSELGALAEVDVIGADGHPRPVKVLPRVWLDRLARAAELGAFERLSVKQIVERILEPSPPPAPALLHGGVELT